VLKYKCGNFEIFINQTFLPLTTMDSREEIAKKKAALAAELYELEQREKEAEEMARKEREEAAARAARRAARKEAKRALREAEKGKKRVVEEDVGETEVEEGPSERPRPKKRVKTGETPSGPDGDRSLEGASKACER
jgi:FKBP-type peptidyl-prolyl cis-trans isomerase